MWTHEPPDNCPDWFSGKKIDEVLFCAAFLEEHPMICVSGHFFSPEGRISDENTVAKQIYDMIKPVWTSGLAKKARNLMETLKIECYSESLAIRSDRIHFANGTLFLDGRFTTGKNYCINRLPVRYDPKAPPPVTWLRFLDDLLHPEDIPTLQEYNLEYTNNVVNTYGRRVRGFWGMQALVIPENKK